MEKAIFFIGLGIFCAVIGLQLGLHNSDIRKLKNEVKELRSENEAFKTTYRHSFKKDTSELSQIARKLSMRRSSLTMTSPQGELEMKIKFVFEKE